MREIRDVNMKQYRIRSDVIICAFTEVWTQRQRRKLTDRRPRTGLGNKPVRLRKHQHISMEIHKCHYLCKLDQGQTVYNAACIVKQIVHFLKDFIYLFNKFEVQMQLFAFASAAAAFAYCTYTVIFLTKYGPRFWCKPQQ